MASTDKTASAPHPHLHGAKSQGRKKHEENQDKASSRKPAGVAIHHNRAGLDRNGRTTGENLHHGCES